MTNHEKSDARPMSAKRTVRALAAVTAALALLAVAPPAQAGGCNWTGCGTTVNATSRGFHVTLQWGAPWAEPWPVRWVGPHSSLGGGGVDVDGIYTGAGCTMTGIIDGRVLSYRYPFVWGSGWHKITTNETLYVLTHVC